MITGIIAGWQRNGYNQIAEEHCCPVAAKRLSHSHLLISSLMVLDLKSQWSQCQEVKLQISVKNICIHFGDLKPPRLPKKLDTALFGYILS